MRLALVLVLAGSPALADPCVDRAKADALQATAPKATEARYAKAVADKKLEPVTLETSSGRTIVINYVADVVTTGPAAPCPAQLKPP